MQNVAGEQCLALQQRFPCIQSFLQRLSHKSTKVHATIPSGIMGSNIQFGATWSRFTVFS